MFISLYAEVAKLADALDSGSSARKGVRVQIPASAPQHLTLPNQGNSSFYRFLFLNQLTPLQTSGLAELSRICRANTQLSTV